MKIKTILVLLLFPVALHLSSIVNATPKLPYFFPSDLAYTITPTSGRALLPDNSEAYLTTPAQKETGCKNLAISDLANRQIILYGISFQ